jgi:hypothetical protein
MKGHLQRAFWLDVSMVPSSVITVTVDGECLMCGGFSLDKIDRLGNFEFIADYFDNLSLSPRRGDSGAAFMGSTQSGTPSSWWAMIGDSIDKFLTMSSGEGRRPPLSQEVRHGAPACSRCNHTMDDRTSSTSPLHNKQRAPSSVGLRPPSRALGTFH